MNPMLSIQIDDDVFQDWKELQQFLLTALQMQEELLSFNDTPLHSDFLLHQKLYSIQLNQAWSLYLLPLIINMVRTFPFAYRR